MINTAAFDGFLEANGWKRSGKSLKNFDPSGGGEGGICKGHDIYSEVLHNEKAAMRMALGTMGGALRTSTVCRKKNIPDSIKYRKLGNSLYDKMSDELTHEKVWRLYTQSIAMAPNGSSELALGYGNRSALLFHLEKFENCIEDCNRAIEITCCEFLKCKLMIRKAECLSFLNRNSVKSVCEEALKKLSELSIDENLKRQFTDKLQNILNTVEISNSSERTNKLEDLSELADLDYQKEAPCASKSVKINYNKKWGRHITATKDIQAGDIVAIEDNFCTLLLKPGMYLFCSYCVQPAWSSIPCRYCIYDVYCSEKCMAEAWIKYHEHECPVYPYIWDIDQTISDGHTAIRMVLIMIHQAGGIKKLKKDTYDVEYSKDMRTVGFSSEGVFHSCSSRSMFSHLYGDDNIIIYSRIYEACSVVHLLAKNTDLFGKKMDLSDEEMLENDDIIFVGCLIARVESLLQKHLLLLTHKFGKESVHYGISFGAFRSLFNHSCNPNTEMVPVKNNKTVMYAKHPVKKGQQLFVSYRGEHYLSNTKRQRQEDLYRLFGFKCRCLPCSENWSNISVPSFDDVFNATPGLQEELQRIFNSIRDCSTTPEEGFKYSLESVKKIKFILKTVSTMVTEHCLDYYKYEFDLFKMYITYFGDWTIDMSHKCINA